MTNPMLIEFDPNKEGITHINVHEKSIFREARLLSPFIPRCPIDSVFGFTYDNMSRVISYMRFKEFAIFDELINADPYSASKLYHKYLATEETCARAHRRAVIYTLYIERVIRDPIFAKSLYLTADYPLALYKPVVTSHHDGRSKMVAGSPNYLSNWIPGILSSVRRDLFERGVIDVKSHLNIGELDNHFLSSLPKYSDMDNVHLDYTWKELSIELVGDLSRLTDDIWKTRSLEGLPPHTID